LQARIAMQLLLSRTYPAVDAQTLTEYLARDTLLRTDDGSFVLYMTSKGQTEGEERILFLGCRDALVWLNESPDAPGSYWQFAEGENRHCTWQNTSTSKTNL
jgi:hypothetical protein